MFFREWLPFFNALCQRLGFEVIASSPTTKRLIHRGVEAVVNEPCFPVKLAHGHLAELMDKSIKRIRLEAFMHQVSQFAQSRPGAGHRG